MNRLALPADSVDELERRLTASAPSEEGAFFLLREGRGVEGTRLVADEMIRPPADAWEHQAEGRLRPSARWLSAAVSAALAAEAGLLFVHSHPCADHPVQLSPVDERSLLSLGATLGDMLPGPFAAAVVHRMGWSGALWAPDGLRPLGTIAAIGRSARVLSCPPGLAPGDRELDARQRDALGELHLHLRNLSVALVGCGGLGSPLAEQLVRMGLRELVVIDHDLLDTESNVRRVFGSRREDLVAGPAKVDIIGRHLEALGLDTRIVRVKGNVVTEPVFRHLLDVDVIIGATDTHVSRAILNDLPSTYLLPVIDVGVRVGKRSDGNLAGLVAELRLLSPDRPCLWCRNVLDPDMIRIENLPREEQSKLRREGYLVGTLGESAPSVTTLGVLGSGMAGCALLGLLSSEGDQLPSSWIFDGLHGDAPGGGAETDPDPDCRCRFQFARADLSPPPLS
jgi:molybdopterin/thiamine biosynthesis adenylyltransferase